MRWYVVVAMLKFRVYNSCKTGNEGETKCYICTANLATRLKQEIAMAIMITDECINCGACEPECPNNAIYEGGMEWRFADGTNLKGMLQLNGSEVDAEKEHEPVDMDVYYITHDKCTECVGFHDEPQCAAVCPVDCCIDDPDHRETEEQLLSKKEFMHL
jgi:ferredoxin